MMRKLLTFLKVIVFIAFMAGCGETGNEINPETTPEIKLPEGVQSSEVSVKSESQSVTVSFSSNVPWMASVSADWIFISPSSGQAGSNTVSIKVMENVTDQPRTATVTITDIDGKSTLTFEINQEAVDRTLTVNPESMTFTAQGGEDKLTVSSNTEWTVGKDVDWITLDSDKGNGDSMIKVIATENQSLTLRTGSITVTSTDGKIKRTVSVQQDGADVVFSIDRLDVSVNAAGEDFTVNVTHNIGYKIDSQPEWVKLTNKATSGNIDTFTFKAEANTSIAAREGVIVFCNDNNECVPVTIKQSGASASLSVSPTNMDFTAKTESKTFTVTSNSDWTATSDASWVKLNASSGNGNAQVTVTTEENTTITQRSATITIKTADGKATANVKVTQSAANVIFSVDKNEFNVASTGESFSVKVTHNIGYKITSMPEWVNQTNKATSGNTDTFTFKADANASTSPREGVIVFCNDNNECVPVTVKQAGASASLSVSPTELAFSAATGSKMISVTSNTDWTATSSASWAKINAANGNGNTQVTVTADENTTITQRNATITIKTADGKATANVKVTQSAANVIFSVDKNEFNVAAAGESFSVKVTHNIGYKITSLPEWVNQTNKTTSGNTDTFTFKADANASTSPREGVIVFCNDNNECVPVTVKQAGANVFLSVTPGSLTFASQGQTKSISIKSNTDWKASSNKSWVNLDMQEGRGDAELCISTIENTNTSERTATITIKTDDGKLTSSINITQNKAEVFLSVSGSTLLTVAANSGCQMISVKSNTKWKVKHFGYNWALASKTEGCGNAQFSINVNENPTCKKRASYVTVMTIDEKIQKEIKIEQEGRKDVIFKAGKNEFNVNAESNYIFVYIYHSIGYKIYSLPDWISMGGYAVTSDYEDELGVSIKKNTNTVPRKGDIVFRNDNGECISITVKQDGYNPELPSLSVSQTSMRKFRPSATSVQFSIRTNSSWIATPSETWIKLSMTSGNGNANVNLYAEANNSLSERMATITVKTTDGKSTCTIYLAQEGANDVFNIEKDEYNVSAIGDNIQINVTHNFGCKIISTPAWVMQTKQISSDGKCTYSFKIDANTSKDIREDVIVFASNKGGQYPVTIKQSGNASKGGGNEDTTTGKEIIIE